MTTEEGTQPADGGGPAEMSDLDYSIMATARLVAVKNLAQPVTTSQLVAAYGTLMKHGWLSGQIDPETHYTMRPTSYTTAELAIVIAELEGRKRGAEYSDQEWATIRKDAEEMSAEGKLLDDGGVDDSRPAWPPEDGPTWQATRAADEKAALKLNARYRSRPEMTPPGETCGDEADGRKPPRPGGDPRAARPPARPHTDRHHSTGSQRTAEEHSYRRQ